MASSTDRAYGASVASTPAQRSPTPVIRTLRGESSSSGSPPDRPLDLDPQERLGHRIQLAGPPLDHDDRVIPVEVEVLDLGAGREAIRVDVHERRAGCGGVLARENERRAGDRLASPEGRAEPAGEGRLAGAELPVEQHQVAGAQQRGEAGAERLHRVGVGDRELDRSSHEDPRHARPDPGHDLVVDGVGPGRPVLGRGDAGRAVAPEHDAVADRPPRRRRRRRGTGPWRCGRRRDTGAADRDLRAVRGVARHAVGVARAARAPGSSRARCGG